MLREFAPIYRALGQRGIGPAEARECELWVIGSILGIGEPKQDDETAPSTTLQVTPELLAARAKARAEGKSFGDLPQPSLRGARSARTMQASAPEEVSSHPA